MRVSASICEFDARHRRSHERRDAAHPRRRHGRALNDTSSMHTLTPEKIPLTHPEAATFIRPLTDVAR
jgi:hypothetical protein